MYIHIDSAERVSFFLSFYECLNIRPRTLIVLSFCFDIMKFHEVTCEEKKYFRKARQMRSARVADHLLRAHVALTAAAASPHRRLADSYASPLIDFLQLISYSYAASARQRAAGRYLAGWNVFSPLHFIFRVFVTDKIFSFSLSLSR